VLGALLIRQTRFLEQATIANFTKLWHAIQPFSIDKKHDLLKHMPNKCQRQKIVDARNPLRLTDRDEPLPSLKIEEFY
jgi:hypothetical protein